MESKKHGIIFRNENCEKRSVDLERHEWEKLHETEINIAEIANKQKLESEEGK